MHDDYKADKDKAAAKHRHGAAEVGRDDVIRSDTDVKIEIDGRAYTVLHNILYMCEFVCVLSVLVSAFLY